MTEGQRQPALDLQNNGPPQAAAAAGDAAPSNAEEEKFLKHMRGWVITVGTLFVNMAFQAALHPPDWLRTTDFLRYSQSDIDRLERLFHGASHAFAAAVAAAPARFAPSPSLSPQAAESETADLSWRAKAYMICNYITFGGALSLVMMLMRQLPPHQAKRTMVAAAGMMGLIALSAVCTVALGTSKDWYYTLFVALVVLYVGFVPQSFVAMLNIIPDIIVLIRQRLAGECPSRAERTAVP